MVFKKIGSFDYEGHKFYDGGVTRGTHLVEFANISYPRFDSMRNNIVHEMGHVFDNNHNNPSNSIPEKYKYNRDLFLHDNNTVMWQADKKQENGETFADMFLAYTYGVWRNPIDKNLREVVYPNNPEYWNPPKWMNDHMRIWIGQ